MRNGGFGGSLIELRDIFAEWRDEGMPGLTMSTKEAMTVQTLQSTVLAEGFTYGEGPRWHDGRLWFSDMHADAVRTLDADGVLGLGAEHTITRRASAGRPTATCS